MNDVSDRKPENKFPSRLELINLERNAKSRPSFSGKNVLFLRNK